MEITKELINKVTKYDFHSFGELDEMYVILLDDKLFSPKCGGIFHESSTSAWKHFYRECNWMAKTEYKRAYAELNGQQFTWRMQTDKTERQIWEEFKSKIYGEHNFKIIKWKDAKGDVCGQSRA